jgi:hypothetical protein
VSTFADRTFAALAERLDMVFHRGSGHHILRTLSAGRMKGMAHRFGPAMSCVRLCAPRGESATGFHGLEGEAGSRFRWTRSNELTWHVDLSPGGSSFVQVAIPYLHESRAGFAAECVVEVDGKPTSVSLRESAIVAEADNVATSKIVVVLRTPSPTKPPRDDRCLGLAVATGDAYQRDDSSGLQSGRILTEQQASGNN